MRRLNSSGGSTGSAGRKGNVGKAGWLVLGLLPAAVAATAHGQSLTWDASGANPATPQDGLGNWDTALANWSNGTADVPWPVADTTDTAIFGTGTAPADVVTIDAAGVSANGLQFNAAASGNYTIAGTTTNNLTLGGTTPTITVASGLMPLISAPITDTAGLTVAGAGTLILTGNLNTSFTYGGITINSGSTLQFGTGANLTATNTLGGAVVDNGSFLWNVNSAKSGGGFATNSFSGGFSGAGSFTLVSPPSATASNGSTNQNAVTFASTANNANFAGAATIQLGTRMQWSNANHVFASGSSVAVQNGGELFINVSSITYNGSLTIDGNGFSGDNANSALWLGAVRLASNDTLAGAITLGPDGATISGGGTLKGQISGTTTLTLGAPASVTTNLTITPLSGGNPGTNAWGATVLASGAKSTAVHLGATNALSSGPLTLGETAAAVGTGANTTLDLAGFSQTVGGLSTVRTDAASLGATFIENDSTTAGASTLTINASADAAYAGNIRDNNAGTGVVGTVAVVKAGTGNQTFGGTGAYTGGTTINGGTLTLASATALPANSSVANNASLAVNANTTAGDISGTGTTSVASGVAFTANGFTQAGLANAGTTQINGSGTSGQITGAGALTIGTGTSANTLALASGSGQSTQSALTVNTGTTLDLTNNSFDIHYGANSSPDVTVRSLVRSGYNGGIWNGTGVTSSTAAADIVHHAVGYADGADNIVPGLASGDELIKYTFAGDANLDGKVDVSDLGILATNYGHLTGQRWDQGDFTYDGGVDVSDLGVLATNYGAGTGVTGAAAAAQFQADLKLVESEDPAFAAAIGAVPEPASLGLLALGSLALLGKRRRK